MSGKSKIAHTNDAAPKAAEAQVTGITEIIVSLRRILAATADPREEAEQAIQAVRYEAKHALKAAKGLSGELAFG